MPAVGIIGLDVYDLDFTALETAGGVAFDEACRDRIVTYCNDYLLNLACQAATPTRGDVRRSLEDIREHARALASIIGDVDQQDAVNLALPSGIEPPGLNETLRRVERQAAQSLDEMPGKTGGRRSRQARAALIQAIRAVWQEAGGRGKGANYDPYLELVGGPFADLMESLLSQLAAVDSRVDDDRTGLAEACRR